MLSGSCMPPLGFDPKFSAAGRGFRSLWAMCDLADSLIGKANQIELSCHISFFSEFKKQKSQHTLARQSQEPLALNSPSHFPLRRTSCVPPVWPQIPLEAFFNDGGGSLQRHEYHMEKSCQDEFRGYFASGLIERRLIKSQRVCVLAR